jgi:hypothetical protein
MSSAWQSHAALDAITRRPPTCRRATRGLPARTSDAIGHWRRRFRVSGLSDRCVDQTGSSRERSRLELQGSESNRPGSRLMRPGRAQPSLHQPRRGRVGAPTLSPPKPPAMSSGGQSPPALDAIIQWLSAGCRGIEPRWPVLETSLIPDRDPKVGASTLEVDNHLLSVRENGRRVAKMGYAPVLPSGIGPASPALQAGAITRSATGAKSWPRLDQGRLCPATGIVIYLIVKDHPRPSPEWLPRFIAHWQISSFG